MGLPPESRGPKKTAIIDLDECARPTFAFRRKKRLWWCEIRQTVALNFSEAICIGPFFPHAGPVMLSGICMDFGVLRLGTN